MSFFNRNLNCGRRLGAGAAIALALSFLGSFGARAGDIDFFVGGASARVPVVSMAERKFTTVVRQQYDFSCGSAALATLLTFHYDRETSETDAFKAMWEVGDQNRIRELGFSLLEMKRYLESLNLKADGFVLSLDRVQEIGVPGIALVDVRGYKHFVVIKGITDEVVLIGDPSSGVVSLPRNIFEQRWDGTILFIRSDVVRGKQSFNQVADWRLAPSAPHDRALDDESLQSLYLNQTRPSFSGFTINTIVEVR
ncbi:C39 family peptidase [Marinicaulis aureus]|uniref:C39 family peptidase n=1 Tax=Hyphococcus aureus TaxID=2666033 RepID=A0ABW1L371_9PROT